jgi:DNA-binding response OmpR family regulator
MAKKRIPCLLVVEDEPAVRNLIVAILKAGGHRDIVTAGNAEEALHYVYRDAGLDIQLALVDLVLPNASGLTLIRKIRNAKAAHRRTLPVVVLTGRTDTDTYKMAARRGIQGYLIKPIAPDLLVHTVEQVLSSRGIVTPKRTITAGDNADDGPRITGLGGVADVPAPPSLGDDSTSGFGI